MASPEEGDDGAGGANRMGTTDWFRPLEGRFWEAAVVPGWTGPWEWRRWLARDVSIWMGTETDAGEGERCGWGLASMPVLTTAVTAADPE